MKFHSFKEFLTENCVRLLESGGETYHIYTSDGYRLVLRIDDRNKQRKPRYVIQNVQYRDENNIWADVEHGQKAGRHNILSYVGQAIPYNKLRHDIQNVHTEDYGFLYTKKLSSLLSVIEDGINRGSDSRKLTHADRDTMEKLYGILKQSIVDIKDSKIVFPMLGNKTLDVRDAAKALGDVDADDAASVYKAMEEHLASILKADDDIFNVRGGALAKNSLSESSASVSWQEKEKNVAASIDDMLKSSVGADGEGHVELRGGDTESDVRVQPKKGNGFYIEVKNNYVDAEYLKFWLTYDGVGKTMDLASSQSKDDDDMDDESDENFKRNRKFEQFFYEKINDVRHAVGSRLSMIAKNAQFCANSIQKIAGLNKKLKINTKLVKKFPQGFSELAKIFNFYLLEWAEKYQIYKSQILYNSLVGDDVEQLLASVERIHSNLERIYEQTECSDIWSIGEFDKFRYMYSMFISTPLVQKDDGYGDGRYVLFSMTPQQTAKRRVATSVIDTIVDYYRNVKKCRYIEIEDDVYSLYEDGSPLFDPFGLVRHGLVHPLSDLRKCGVKIEVSVKYGIRLRLNIWLQRPDGLRNLHSFEEIGDMMKNDGDDTAKVRESISRWFWNKGK